MTNATRPPPRHHLRATLPVWGLAGIGLAFGLLVLGTIVYSIRLVDHATRTQAVLTEFADAVRGEAEVIYRQSLRSALGSLSRSDIADGAGPDQDIEPPSGGWVPVPVPAALPASEAAEIDKAQRQLGEEMDSLAATARDSARWAESWHRANESLGRERAIISELVLRLRAEFSSADGSLRLEGHRTGQKLRSETDLVLLDVALNVQRLLASDSEDEVADILGNHLTPGFRELDRSTHALAGLSPKGGNLVEMAANLRGTVLGGGDAGALGLAARMSEHLGLEREQNALRWRVLERIEAASTARKDFRLAHERLVERAKHAGNRTVRRAWLLVLAAGALCGAGFILAARALARGLVRTLEARDAAAAELRASQAQLLQVQKLESIGQLASGIAHEINTPTQYVGDNLRFLKEQFAGLLRVVDSCTHMLDPAKEPVVWRQRVDSLGRTLADVDYEFLRREVPQALEQSIEGLGRVASIVQAMKDFSHPGSAVKEAADLNHAIESTATVCRNRWKYIARLELNLDKGLPRVPCLIGEMNQVLLNLLVNAADAIEQRHGESGGGVIRVRSRRAGDFAEILVEDNGGGIPPEAQAKVFDPFFTTKAVGKGTGQGLAICRNVVVNKHGGSIDFATTPGAGTVFTVRLPLREPAQAAREAA